MGKIGTTLLAMGAALTVSAAPKAKQAVPQSAAPPGICGALVNEITTLEQAIAMTEEDGIGDDSAPRATLRATQQAEDLERIQANLSLMSAHHCAPLEHVISKRRWIMAAIDCRTHQLEVQNAQYEHKPSPVSNACDRSTWKPAD